MPRPKRRPNAVQSGDIIVQIRPPRLRLPIRRRRRPPPKPPLSPTLAKPSLSLLRLSPRLHLQAPSQPANPTHRLGGVTYPLLLAIAIRPVRTRQLPNPLYYTEWPQLTGRNRCT